MKQVKQRTAVEEEKLRRQQRVEEEKYIGSVRAQMEKDEKSLLEYQVRERRAFRVVLTVCVCVGGCRGAAEGISAV